MEYLVLFVVLFVVAGIYLSMARAVKNKLINWAEDLKYTYVPEPKIEGIGELRNYMVFPLRSLFTGYICKQEKDYTVYCFIESKRYNNLIIIFLSQKSKPWIFEFREKHFLDKPSTAIDHKDLPDNFVLLGRDAERFHKTYTGSPAIRNIFKKDSPAKADYTKALYSDENSFTLRYSCTSIRLRNPAPILQALEHEFKEIIMPLLKN